MKRADGSRSFRVLQEPLQCAKKTRPDFPGKLQNLLVLEEGVEPSCPVKGAGF